MEIKLERVKTSDPNLVLAYQTIDDLRKQIDEHPDRKRLDSFIDATVGKRLTYQALIGEAK